MRVDGNFALFSDMRPAVLVVSHERSGTHFLMNALAACYDYVSSPWIDFDRQTFNINFFYPPEVGGLLMALADRPMANIVKSHHPIDFFNGELKRIVERYLVLVVCRHPADVTRSFWRFLHQWPWNEGPKTLDPLSFARAEPCGRLMRYQPRQYPSMLQRWAAHADGWLNAADENERVGIVRYEDLDRNYEQTMRGLAGKLGRAPRTIVRPDKDYNVIPRGPSDPTGELGASHMNELREYCRATVGQTMSRLGY